MENFSLASLADIIKAFVAALTGFLKSIKMGKVENLSKFFDWGL